jgi:hypothetical protein
VIMGMSLCDLLHLIWAKPVRKEAAHNPWMCFLTIG